jgi:hypothetical protein
LLLAPGIFWQLEQCGLLDAPGGVAHAAAAQLLLTAVTDSSPGFRQMYSLSQVHQDDCQNRICTPMVQPFINICGVYTLHNN